MTHLIFEQPTIGMKSSVLWNITPRSSLKANRRFGGTCSLNPEGWRVSKVIYQSDTVGKQGLAICFNAGLSEGTEDEGKRHVPTKRRLTFNGLQGVTSQKTELFITTAVRCLSDALLIM
jgi:hypothetical protein